MAPRGSRKGTAPKQGLTNKKIAITKTVLMNELFPPPVKCRLAESNKHELVRLIGYLNATVNKLGERIEKLESTVQRGYNGCATENSDGCVTFDLDAAFAEPGQTLQNNSQEQNQTSQSLGRQ